MNSPAFEALGLDDAVKMTAGRAAAPCLFALYPTFDAQQYAPRQ